MKPIFPFAFTLIPLGLVSCLSSEPQNSALVQNKTPTETPALDQRVMEKWARSCALCHVTGEANAPKIGDTENWNNRLINSEEEILRRVLYGYNSMPPLGYCMSCEIADFKKMISFMAGRAI